MLCTSVFPTSKEVLPFVHHGSCTCFRGTIYKIMMGGQDGTDTYIINLLSQATTTTRELRLAADGSLLSYHQG